MLTLKLDEIPEEGLDLTWEEERASVLAYLNHLSGIDFGFETPMGTEVKIRKVGPSILIQGNIRTVLRLSCVRCLKEFTYPLSSAFDLTLHPLRETSFKEEAELTGEEMESNFFDGEEIRLTEIACEQVFLDVPYQPLCDAACKGLCLRCGKDLNLSACDCSREGFGSGFSALQKLKLG